MLNYYDRSPLLVKSYFHCKVASIINYFSYAAFTLADYLPKSSLPIWNFNRLTQSLAIVIDCASTFTDDNLLYQPITNLFVIARKFNLLVITSKLVYYQPAQSLACDFNVLVITSKLVYYQQAKSLVWTASAYQQLSSRLNNLLVWM